MNSVKKIPRILIGTPTRDVVQGTYVCDLVPLIKSTLDIVFAMTFGTQVANSRELLVDTAIKNDAKYVLFIDSDMRFPPDTVDRLLKANKDIVGANCKQRSQDQTTARKNGQFIPSKDKTGLEEVDTLGFGVTLIKTRLFKKLPKPWFSNPWNVQEQKLEGEDYYFCTKARSRGFTVWVDHDLSNLVKHTGNIEFEV